MSTLFSTITMVIFGKLL